MTLSTPPCRPESGFTLIELMIVIAIIAIIAAIAIPNLLSARLNANETSAISTLRNVSSSEAQFQAAAKSDVDSDGSGEFGLFRELSGAVGVRTSADASAVGAVLNPPVLSGAFRTFNTNHEVSRSGYLFHMILPGAAGIGVMEKASGALAAALNSDLAETTWCCYAWPAAYSRSGNRTFFANETGDIVGTDWPAYSGTLAFINTNAGAAFTGTTLPGNITGTVAVGTRGRDGRVWKQIN